MVLMLDYDDSPRRVIIMIPLALSAVIRRAILQRVRVRSMVNGWILTSCLLRIVRCFKVHISASCSID